MWGQILNWNNEGIREPRESEFVQEAGLARCSAERLQPF